MLNHVVLVGRLVSDPKIIETETGAKQGRITIAVPRSFKNMNGEYDTDFIDCVLWDSIAKSTKEYCYKGDVVGVKGRLQTETIEHEDGTKKYILSVVAEKVTFLSSKPKEREEENGD